MRDTEIVEIAHPETGITDIDMTDHNREIDHLHLAHIMKVSSDQKALINLNNITHQIVHKTQTIKERILILTIKIDFKVRDRVNLTHHINQHRLNRHLEHIHQASGHQRPLITGPEIQIQPMVHNDTTHQNLITKRILIQTITPQTQETRIVAGDQEATHGIIQEKNEFHGVIDHTPLQVIGKELRVILREITDQNMSILTIIGKTKSNGEMTQIQKTVIWFTLP